MINWREILGCISLRLLLLLFYDANTRPCHPERRSFATGCEMTESNPVGARKARDLRANSIPPRRSSKRCKRFDFQKSAIYCRFLKVRRENTRTGCFLAQDDTRGCFLRLFISPRGCISSAQRAVSHQAAGDAECTRARDDIQQRQTEVCLC